MSLKSFTLYSMNMIGHHQKNQLKLEHNVTLIYGDNVAVMYGGLGLVICPMISPRILR